VGEEVLQEAAIVDGRAATVSNQAEEGSNEASAQKSASSPELEEEVRREVGMKEEARSSGREEGARVMSQREAEQEADKEVVQEAMIIDEGAATVSRQMEEGNNEATAQKSVSERKEEVRGEARMKEASSRSGEERVIVMSQKEANQAVEGEVLQEAAIVDEGAATVSKQTGGGNDETMAQTIAVEEEMMPNEGKEITAEKEDKPDEMATPDKSTAVFTHEAVGAHDKKKKKKSMLKGLARRLTSRRK